MRRSLNEIETTLVKAARGAGQPFGIAEDVARAGVWLCRLGCDGVSLTLKSFEVAEPTVYQLVVGDQAITLPEGPAIQAAVSCIDLALTEPEAAIQLPVGLPVPQILVGLAGQATAQYGTNFAITFGGAEAIQVMAAGTSTLPARWPADVALTVALTAASTAEPAVRLTQDRPDVDDATWQRAEALAALTYVPASEQSRASGAGAGLTDND